MPLHSVALAIVVQQGDIHHGVQLVHQMKLHGLYIANTEMPSVAIYY